jgi:hypothetical protein
MAKKVLLFLSIVALGAALGCGGLWTFCEIDRPGEVRTHVSVAAYLGVVYGLPAGALVGVVVGILTLRKRR